ncbi:hypothetical protein A0H81_00630 [Grifola frondosa]|uniref:Uncharacterized protein n=1 Tax=Grifola frondosa TaxID=5627 RepID=A0A1C7MRW0_GRIFR|nr:hypothetical protein A0H81_00630 [Grifola frondosa]
MNFELTRIQLALSSPSFDTSQPQRYHQPAIDYSQRYWLKILETPPSETPNFVPGDPLNRMYQRCDLSI